MSHLDVFNESFTEDAMRDQNSVEIICEYQVLGDQIPILFDDFPVPVVHFAIEARTVLVVVLAGETAVSIATGLHYVPSGLAGHEYS